MSTLRVSNIEAKADVSSPSVNEKVKVTNSNGELLVHIDGATSGITTVGINTSGESVRFDSNQNVTFFGDITGTGLDINGNADISGNLNVGGVLTYEDVTNIDSVGIITAQAGIRVTGGSVGIGTDTPTQVLTVRAGSTPQILLKTTDATPAFFVGDSNRTGAGQHLSEYRGNWNGTNVARIIFAAGADTTNKDDGIITFNTASAGSTIERLRITSDGNVGVGLVNPTSEFHVKGVGTVATFEGTGGNGFIALKDSDDSTTAFIGVDGGSLKFQTSGSSYSDKLVITSDGSVSIGGLVASSGNLVVNSTIRSQNASNHISYIGFTQYTGSTTVGSMFSYMGGDGRSSGYLNFSTNDTERLRITSGGDVNIGPSANANGHGLLTLSQSAAAAFNALVIQQGNTAFTATDGLQIGIDAGVHAYIKQYENRDIYFTTGNPNTEKLRITSAGLLGVGNNNPTYKVSVKDTKADGTGVQMHLWNNSVDNTAGNVWSGIRFTGSTSNYETAEIKGWRVHPGTNLNSLSINTGGVERMALTSGLVRVGDVTANYGSNVTQDLVIKGRYVNAAGDFSRLIFGNSDDSGGSTASIRAERTGNNFGTELKFFTNPQSSSGDGLERLRINRDGHLTKSATPAFCVYRNQSNWSLSGGDTFIFNAAEFNVGGHYNSANGRFTAPTTGTYIFHFYSIYLNSSSNDYIQMYKNNARMLVGDIHFTNSIGSYWDNITYTRIIQLNANDYVHMRTATAQTYHGNHWGGWTGYMLG